MTRFEKLTLVGLAAAFSVLMYHLHDFIIDDAYIIFRYSKNLVEHLTLNWNPGEDPVEGYTSFTWVLIHTIPIALRIDPALFAKCLSYFLALSTFYIIIRSSSVAPAAPRTLVIAALATSPVFAFASLNGLETAFAAFLLTAVYAAAAQTLRSPPPENLRNCSFSVFWGS